MPRHPERPEPRQSLSTTEGLTTRYLCQRLDEPPRSLQSRILAHFLPGPAVPERLSSNPHIRRPLPEWRAGPPSIPPLSVSHLSDAVALLGKVWTRRFCCPFLGTTDRVLPMTCISPSVDRSAPCHVLWPWFPWRTQDHVGRTRNLASPLSLETACITPQEACCFAGGAPRVGGPADWDRVLPMTCFSPSVDRSATWSCALALVPLADSGSCRQNQEPGLASPLETACITPQEVCCFAGGAPRVGGPADWG